MSFTPVGSYYLVVALLALAAGVVACWARHDRFQSGRRRVLIGLRVLVILLVLLAMLRPDDRAQPRSCGNRRRSSCWPIARAACRWPTSAGKKSRWETMTSALEDIHPALQDLRELFEVKLYTFDGETYPIDIDRPTFDLGARPEGRQTAIGAALEDVLRREAGKRLAGIILLSDGAQRAVAAARHSAASAGSPPGRSGLSAVHGSAGPGPRLGPGSRRGHRRSAACRSRCFVKNQLDVRARCASKGSSIRSCWCKCCSKRPPGKMEPVASQPRAGPPGWPAIADRSGTTCRKPGRVQGNAQARRLCPAKWSPPITR